MSALNRLYFSTGSFNFISLSLYGNFFQRYYQFSC